ncbi:MAG: adenine-specific methyltransferase EcoRI family protein [Lachnospiraceae bacterium]|nr:adenine-specific methyltransferase EcoRI family protein [Lachnospiraceae bacterium]
MANNADLHKAQTDKKDEFYTQLEDIEAELKYYKPHFKNKVVFCNCDDPYESNFFKYFAMNFNFLGLKKLIATCYATSPVMYTQLTLFGDEEPTGVKEKGKKPYKVEITEVKDVNGDGAIDLEDVEALLKKNKPKLLKGDGDFRSEECIELLKEADIVVTNPPFSLFRDYVAVLEQYKKKYLIIGNVNALTYKEIFPLIKDNKLWLGASIHSGDREFRVPDSYPLNASSTRIDEHGRKYIRVKGVRWWTNLDYKQRHEDLILYKKYSPKEYPKYDNYDAIDVCKTSEIPCDYDDIMGVPVTFLDKYNPEQFEIIGCADYTGLYGSDYIGVDRIGEEWITKYRKQGGKGHYTANMRSLVYYDEQGKACNTFKRVLIRRRKSGD